MQNLSLENLVLHANKTRTLYTNKTLGELIVSKAQTANMNTLKKIINSRTGGLNAIKSMFKQIYNKRYLANKVKTLENKQLEYNKGNKDIRQMLYLDIRIGLQNIFYKEALKIKLKPPMKLVVENVLTETGTIFPNVTLQIYDQNNQLVTYEECQFSAPWELVLETGETFLYPKQGWGTFIRALAIYIAKMTGKIRYVSQISKNIRRMRPGGRPPSATIMNKLGLNILPGKDPKNNTLEFRGTNINRTKVNTIVKNKIL